MSSNLKCICNLSKKTLILAIILFLYLPLSSQSLKYSEFLKLKINTLENKYGSCSAVLLDFSTNEIIYVYNKKIASKLLPAGSLFKVFTAIVLYENQELFNFDPSNIIECKGYFHPNDYSFLKEDIHNYNLPIKTNKNIFNCSKLNGHGPIDLESALIHSCNSYFLQTTESIRYSLYTKLNKTFKFNSLSGCRRNPPKTSFDYNISFIGEGDFYLFNLYSLSALFSGIFTKSNIVIFNPKSLRYLSYSSISISDETRFFIRNSLSEVATQGTLKEINIRNKNIKIIASKSGSPTKEGFRYKTHGLNMIYFSKNSNDYILLTFAENGSGSGSALKLSEIILNNLNF